mmetsp:Transcript_69794/g.202559  ORF Transcript_69794/g.202559 Transcript_69794/m.202559 type:complete len:215 (-) Transcript_69794:524-1168(-)
MLISLALCGCPSSSSVGRGGAVGGSAAVASDPIVVPDNEASQDSISRRVCMDFGSMETGSGGIEVELMWSALPLSSLHELDMLGKALDMLGKAFWSLDDLDRRGPIDDREKDTFAAIKDANALAVVDPVSVSVRSVTNSKLDKPCMSTKCSDCDLSLMSFGVVCASTSNKRCNVTLNLWFTSSSGRSFSSSPNGSSISTAMWCTDQNTNTTEKV